MDFRYKGRIVTLNRRNLDTSALVSGILLLGSNYYYYSRVFKNNRNFLMFGLFIIPSYFVAGFYGRAISISPTEEAAVINNDREIKHLKLLGKSY